jgi:hypothetical protein
MHSRLRARSGAASSGCSQKYARDAGSDGSDLCREWDCGSVASAGADQQQSARLWRREGGAGAGREAERKREYGPRRMITRIWVGRRGQRRADGVYQGAYL